MKSLQHPIRLAACAALVTWWAVALSHGANVRDASGRNVAISDASRVVSIGGAVTEILYALGQDKRVIAVDTTSLYPPDALRTKPSRFFSLDGLYMLGFGPRTARAARDLGRLLYPDMKPAALPSDSAERGDQACAQ